MQALKGKKSTFFGITVLVTAESKRIQRCYANVYNSPHVHKRHYILKLLFRINRGTDEH